jgi:hypothetical protein
VDLVSWIWFCGLGFDLGNGLFDISTVRQNLQNIFHINCDELPDINTQFFKQLLLAALLQIPGLQ